MYMQLEGGGESYVLAHYGCLHHLNFRFLFPHCHQLFLPVRLLHNLSNRFFLPSLPTPSLQLLVLFALFCLQVCLPDLSSRYLHFSYLFTVAISPSLFSISSFSVSAPSFLPPPFSLFLNVICMKDRKATTAGQHSVHHFS